MIDRRINDCQNINMASNTSLEKLKPVYLIYGLERYLLDEALDRLKAVVAEGGDLSLNYQKIIAPIPAEQIIDACLTIPFLGDRRLVVVEDYEDLSAGDKSKLADYVNNPVPHAILVLVQAGANKSGKVKVDKRTRLFKAVEAKGKTFDYKLDSAGISRWIKDAFLKRNKVATDEAVNYLRESVISDLWRLEMEIEKISLFADDVKKVNADHIKAAVSPSSDAGVFDLINSIIEGDKGLALILLNRLMEEKDAAGRIHYLLEDQFRLLIKTQDLLSQNSSEREMAAALKVSPQRVYFLKHQSRFLSKYQLVEALKLLAEADYQRKSGRQEARLILEKLIIDIIDAGGRNDNKI